MRTQTKTASFLAISLAATALFGRAQDPATDLAAGIQSFQSYHGGSIDPVNLSNGNLHVRIPLIAYSQRGGKLKLDYALEYNGKSLTAKSTCINLPKSPCDDPAQFGWVASPNPHGWGVADEQDVGITFHPLNFRLSTVQTTVYEMATFWTADGASHPGAPITSVSGQSGQVSLDGTGFFTGAGDDSLTTCTSHCYISDSNGISYHPSSGIVREDSNGNWIGVGSNGTITDTMGRNIPPPPAAPIQANSNSTAGCTGQLPIFAVTTWQTPGVNGASLAYKFCWVGITVNIPPDVVGGDSVAFYATPPVTSMNAKWIVRLQSVVLPNNEGAWTFEYNSQNPGDPACGNGQPCDYGDLTKITFPTGGSISYTYHLVMSLGGPSMWVASRTVRSSDSDIGGTWQYSLDTGGGVFPRVVRVTDPNGNDTVHTFTNYGSGSTPYPMETSAKSYSGPSSSGAVLKSTTTAYQSGQYYFSNMDAKDFVVAAFPTQVVTTLDNGKVSETDTAYCCSITVSNGNSAYQSTATYGRPSDVKVYDYGSGARGSLLQEKATAYKFQSNSNFLVNNLLNAESAEDVYDGSGNHMASTSFFYDESQYLIGSGYGTSQQLSGSILTGIRGNLTSTTHWLSGGTSPTNHTNWYDDGEPYQIIDAKGNAASTFAYSSGVYWGALPVSIANAKSQKVQYSYDTAGLGLKTAVTDANSQTTNYSYDATGRTTQVLYPNTCPGNGSVRGETDYTYVDTVPVSFTVSEVSCSNPPNVEKMDIDGLGRKDRTELQSDPDGTDYTDTVYDALGRIYTVSNPYRTTGDKTYGLTTYGYDALSRPISVTHPDGSANSTSYTGAATKATDEGNGTRNLSTVAQRDALGRIVSACEVTSASQQGSSSPDTTPTSCGQDIAATGFLTSYAYDGLGNLKTTAQGSLIQRSFSYDTLARLVSAFNPESGTTTYTYDANGNVVTRARPAPNQASNGTALATTSYLYDILNRVTDVTYTDAYNTSSPTPPVHFDYDTISGAIFTVPSAVNLVGRMVDSYVKSGSTYIAGRAFNYGPTGAETNLTECTVDNCSSGWNYAFANSFDVNGSPVSLAFQTAGVTNFTLRYGYNATAELTSMTSDWIDTTHPGTLVSSAHYGPLGGLTSATLGNGDTETFAFDQLDRLGCGTIAKNGTPVYSVALSNANTQCSTFSGSGYSGNGNVVSSQDSVNGNWNYAYDDLNRLISANATTGPLSGTSMTWSYDRFGNRWSQTGANAQSNTYTGHNNRIDGAAYDAAGNLLVANGNQYVYDDENRIVSVSLYLGGTASYAYDAEGQRVRKVAGTTVEEYVYDSAGHQFGTIQSSGAMKRIELYVGARHLATYDIASNATYFIHGDWQGTERLRTNSAGVVYETCSNLPFGDEQQCSGGADISPMHFTGKPRDTETNLDYFGARYYSSGMARWMSPDWADKPTTVPYAQFGNPQSLNLYGYVTDNPVSRQDGDGHDMLPPPPAAYGGYAGAVAWYSQLMPSGGFTISAVNSGGAQQQPSKQEQVKNAGLGLKNLATCTTEFFGSGFNFTLANLPDIDATQNLKGAAVGETRASMVPDEGRATILIDKGTFSSSTPAHLAVTYMHEAANARAMQQFTQWSGPDFVHGGISRQDRALLGPMGRLPSNGQRHSSSTDHDIGNQFERCLNGSPLE